VQVLNSLYSVGTVDTTTETDVDPPPAAMMSPGNKPQVKVSPPRCRNDDVIIHLPITIHVTLTRNPPLLNNI